MAEVKPQVPIWARLVGETCDKKADVYVVDGKVWLTRHKTREIIGAESITGDRIAMPVSNNWHEFCKWHRGQNQVDAFYRIYHIDG